MPDHSSTQAIRAYYDQNTRLFLRFGSSPAAQTIHRAVWAPGVQTLPAALQYTNDLLLSEINALPGKNAPLRLVDLGCGVGATLFYLLPRISRPVRSAGLTISSIQARLARRNTPAGLPYRPEFIEADFHHPPLAAGFDYAWSIEAYIHASNAPAYLSSVSSLLAPGGRLALCDDFLAPLDPPDPDARSRRWLDAYQQGWHAPNLHPVAHTAAMAADCGLRLLTDHPLTQHLRLRLLPDALASLLLALGSRLPQRHAILPSMLGSMALQQCLHMGLVEYHFLVFEKLEL